jgi:23S rRNA (cytidine1920-2'-O)/16S rRNA (cytidine1409-2'-O)-methyltransferase
MKKGTRLDVCLAERGLSESREKARREIIAGWVRIGGETVREPSHCVSGHEEISVERPGGVYVSRGGEKLAHALSHFSIDVRGMVIADLGASTGGFTDCLLKNGASLVYAIDVGYGQLDYRLRQNPSVVVVERTNARSLTRQQFEKPPGFVTADLSFISIIKILDVITGVFAPVEGLLLLKPQFEADKSEQKKGVVKKIEHHRTILKRVLGAFPAVGVSVRGLCYSPIKGPAGNIEFFAYIKTTGTGPLVEEPLSVKEIDRVVNEAHRVLNGAGD